MIGFSAALYVRARAYVHAYVHAYVRAYVHAYLHACAASCGQSERRRWLLMVDCRLQVSRSREQSESGLSEKERAESIEKTMQL